MDNKVFFITTKRLFCIVLMLVSACRLFAADQKVQEMLNLSSTSIAGTTIYYEKSFEQKMPVFEMKCRKFLAEKNTGSQIISDKDRVIADINQILGISESQTINQDKIWTELLKVFSIEKITFYLVKQDTTKNFLYSGGRLPNFTYDIDSNMIAYNPEIKIIGEDGPVKNFDFTFLIASDETFEKNIDLLFQILQKGLGSGKISNAIHEVVESGLLNRAEPTDPFWRWFSEGFANAITIEILKKHAGFETAEQFAKAYYISEYKTLEKEINLRYWMGLNFCIKTPLEYENELEAARYAYATQEAQRLIEKHGIDCVRKILDKLLINKTRTARDILQAINEVTGEDMQKRFGHYQTFETSQDGIAKYGSLFNAALEKKDYEQMLVTLLRTLELQESQLSPTSLQCYKEIALLLFQMGHEQAGDEAMHNCVELFKNSGIPLARDAALETFIIYAFNCNNAKKAWEIAGELLKHKPNHVLALTVQMVVHAEDGRISEAKKIAQQVISLDKNEQSPAYRTAVQILAANADKKDSDKEPVK